MKKIQTRYIDEFEELKQIEEIEKKAVEDVVASQKVSVLNLMMTKVDSMKGLSHQDEQKTLSKREVNYARSVVRRMHPLRNLPITLALPFLSYFSHTADS